MTKVHYITTMNNTAGSSPRVLYVDFAKQMNNGTLAGVEVIEFTLSKSETIDKRAMYQAECDHITAEIMRRKLIGDLSVEEEADLISQLTQKSIQIKQL